MSDPTKYENDTHTAAFGLNFDGLRFIGDRKRVLVVDDDLDTITILKLTLRQAGLEVEEALNSDEAIQKCILFQPDIILLDLMMPVVDGWETLMRLRQITDTPVVILSAKHTKKAVIKGLDIGADDYVAKPFYPTEVVSRIQAVLRRSNKSPQESEIAAESL
jgi:DNA-binding response OmpR family regulator